MENNVINKTGLTPYMPVSSIKTALREKSQELRIKYEVRSMFFFDGEENIIYIVTNDPWNWIGKNGQDVEDLTNQCNHYIDLYNETHKDYTDFQKEHIKINFIEADYL